MFTIDLIKHKPSISFDGVCELVDANHQYRSLGEIVAIARQTGVPPLATRNGVYVGDLIIPRDKHDKANLQRQMTSEMLSAETKLSDATKKLNEQKEIEKVSKLEAEIREKISQETNS